MIESFTHTLIDTAREMMRPGAGILAADESNRTANKRLRAVGVEETEEMRRQYRELLFSTPDIEKYLSGVILYDETVRQKDFHKRSFVEALIEKGIIPGIKVDKSTVPLAGFPEEVVTEGLDGLRERLIEYAEMGLRFAKWRAVIRIGGRIPSEGAITANAHVLARYARECQEVGIVPIIEPEVLYDGDHSIDRSEIVITETIRRVFLECDRMRVLREGVILKSSFALPGKENGIPMDSREVARRTARALTKSVPEGVPGVVFLSGGQTPEQATKNLNDIARLEPLPFAITFSYARALQAPALDAWRGESDNWEKAQDIFKNRLIETVAADRGEYEG